MARPQQGPGAGLVRNQLAPERLAARATTTTTLLQTCAAGMGLALLVTPVGDADPRLVRVLGTAAIPAADSWALYHQDDRDNPRVRAVAAWLKDIL